MAQPEPRLKPTGRAARVQAPAHRGLRPQHLTGNCVMRHTVRGDRARAFSSSFDTQARPWLIQRKNRCERLGEHENSEVNGGIRMAGGSGDKDKLVKAARGRDKAQGQQRKSGACSAATFSTFRFWPVTAPQGPRDRQD
jgi:hypothetical protein